MPKKRKLRQRAKALPVSRRAKTGRRSRSRQRIQPDEKLEIALKYLREGRSQKRAAEIGAVSVKRFRAFLRSNRLAKFKNGRWVVTDRRVRQISIVSDGRRYPIQVRGFGPASLAMRHRAAVQTFLYTNDIAVLAPFEGRSIADTSKKKHLLETRPNVLLRLANAGSDAEMKIYRLID